MPKPEVEFANEPETPKEEIDHSRVETIPMPQVEEEVRPEIVKKPLPTEEDSPYINKRKWHVSPTKISDYEGDASPNINLVKVDQQNIDNSYEQSHNEAATPGIVFSTFHTSNLGTNGEK